MNKISKFIQKHHVATQKLIFYTASLSGIFLFIINGFISRGYSFSNLFQNNKSDYFMDYYNVLASLFTGPYATGSIYPPLPLMINKLMLRLVPYNVVSHGAMAIRASQAGQIVFLFYTLVTLLTLFILIIGIKKGSTAEKYFFSFIILFSEPFLFEFERGNVILVALLFLMIFTFFKDSKNFLIREAALISLAISSAIKIYPIIFILLLVKDKQYKDSCKVILYCMILFVLPFIALGGLDQVSVMLRNFSTTSSGTLKWGVGYSVGILTISRIIGALCGNFGSFPIFIGNMLTYVILLFGAISALLIRSKWKTIALLSLLIILVPSISFEYSLIFMIIPLITFLDYQVNYKRIDYIPLICFILIFIPFSFGNVDSINYGFGIHARPLTYGVLIQNFVLFIMVCYLMIQGLKEWMVKTNI